VSPYKGLESFGDTELDALLFFGRERETETIVANVFANRLTVVYGPSGVGKSSLLRAGVAQRLRADGAVVVVHDTWAEQPLDALIGSVHRQVPELGIAAGLVDTIAAAAQARGELYLVLDQLEEYFLYHGSDGPLVELLPELLRRPGLRLSVLIGVRDDALAELDAFTGRLPGIFGNLLRLDRLGRRASRQAILGPLDAYGRLRGGDYDAEPALVEALLDQSLEAPFLQLVLEQLWAEEQEQGSATLRLETLRRLGGPEAIVRDHVAGTLDRLEAGERAAAARVVRQLVTASGAKVSHTEADLAEYAQVDTARLRPLLAALTQERILRAVDRIGGSGPRYEIFHDVLAEPLLAWRQAAELERERTAARTQRRRLLGVVAATTLALLIVATVAVYALTQRSAARSQARHSHAHELAAQALAELPSNPASGLALALRAARLSPDSEAAAVLRDSLLALREQRVIRLGGQIAGAAFAPHGDYLLAASTNGDAGLYRRDGTRILQLPRGRALTQTAWSPDGTLFATGDAAGTATIWETATGRPLRVVRTTAPVSALSFVGHILLVGSGGHLRIVYGTHGTIRTLRVAGAVVSAALRPNGKTVAVAERRAGHVSVQLISVATRLPLATLPERGVVSLVFSPNGRLLATGSTDKTARLWNAANGRLEHVLPQRGHVVAERFSADGQTLVTASTDGTAAVWDVHSGQRQLLLTGATGPALDAATSPDGSEFVVAFADRTARIYNSIDGRILAPLAGHGDAVTSVSFDPTGRVIATGSDDGTVRLWNATASDELEPIASRSVAAKAFLAQLARRSRVGRVGALARAHVQHIAVSSDGSTVATTDARDAFLWDAKTGALLHTLAGHRGLITDVAFSPDGRAVVTSSVDHDARIWDVASGRLLHVLRGHFFPVYSAAFSPDGDWVVTASQLTAGLWSAATGQLVEYLRGSPKPLQAAAFGSGGTSILAVSRDGIVREAQCAVCQNIAGLERTAAARLALLAPRTG
jgi:WD40 repeat protein